MSERVGILFAAQEERMAKPLCSCYRPLLMRFRRQSRAMLRAVTVVGLFWAARVPGETALVLQPPAWPGLLRVVEEPAQPRSTDGAPPPLFLALASAALRAFFAQQAEAACPSGGAIRLVCRGNGSGLVLFSEVAGCRLPLADRQEVSATGEFALELPSGVDCNGIASQACMAAVVRKARLLASVTDGRRGGVTTAEVRQPENTAAPWAVPCRVEPEAEWHPPKAWSEPTRNDHATGS